MRAYLIFVFARPLVTSSRAVVVLSNVPLLEGREVFGAPDRNELLDSPGIGKLGRA